MINFIIVWVDIKPVDLMSGSHNLDLNSISIAKVIKHMWKNILISLKITLKMAALSSWGLYYDFDCFVYQIVEIAGLPCQGEGRQRVGHLVSLVTWTLPQAAIEQNNDNNAPFYCFIIIILAPTITSEANTKLFLG